MTFTEILSLINANALSADKQNNTVPERAIVYAVERKLVSDLTGNVLISANDKMVRNAMRGISLEDIVLFQEVDSFVMRLFRMVDELATAEEEVAKAMAEPEPDKKLVAEHDRRAMSRRSSIKDLIGLINGEVHSFAKNKS